MQYAVLQKLSQAQGRVVCELDSPVPVGTGAEWAGPVRGTIALANAGSVISALGRLHATVCCECSRCLAAHNVPLVMDVNEECILAQADEPITAEDNDPDDAAAEPIPILDRDVVDLTELVRQVLTLNVPPRSLCKADCAGLCRDCGANKNLGPCNCADDQSNSPWATLKQLAKDS